jgi:hypothetical protein
MECGCKVVTVQRHGTWRYGAVVMIRCAMHSAERARAIAAFRQNLAALTEREARCPACAKARREAEGTLAVPVCAGHQRQRNEVAFGGQQG